MKTYQRIDKLNIGEVLNLGDSPIGGCLVRKTSKGVIATNSKGNFYIKKADIEKAFGNLNAIGLQTIEYATKSKSAA